jgi:hypothetical protein
MALARFTLTNTVTIAAGTPAADSNGFGLVTWAGPAGPPQQWAAPFPVTIPKGTVVLADSSGGTSATCQLYAAIGAGNLAAYRDGTDAVGHAALAN